MEKGEIGTTTILIILIPLSSPIILEVVFESGLGERYGPVLASTLLLAAPTILLGMISPFSLRISTDNILKVGVTSGGLSSVNTIGSILGTFFTVFALIPFFGVREILLSLGLILVAVSLVALPWYERFFTQPFHFVPRRSCQGPPSAKRSGSKTFGRGSSA